MHSYVAEAPTSTGEISDTLDADQSIGDPAGQGPSSFREVIRRISDVAEGRSRTASDAAAGLAQGRPSQAGMRCAGRTGEQVIDSISRVNESVADLDAEVDAMTAASRTHALASQKATEVAGHDYSETVHASAFVGRAGIGRSCTLDQGFCKQAGDGKQHTLFDVGAVEIYATR